MFIIIGNFVLLTINSDTSVMFLVLKQKKKDTEEKKIQNKKKNREKRYRISDLIVLGCILFSEKAVAAHSSTPAWKIPWVEEPGGLQSMGSLRVGHD